MTFTIDLPEEQEAALRAEARAQGIRVEQLLQRLVEERLQPVRFPGSGDAQPPQIEPFWKAFTRRMHALPSDVFERLPPDGASEHDHYLYGSPKRDS
jgi:hypothetical protein